MFTSAPSSYLRERLMRNETGLFFKAIDNEKLVTLKEIIPVTHSHFKKPVYNFIAESKSNHSFVNHVTVSKFDRR